VWVGTELDREGELAGNSSPFSLSARQVQCRLKVLVSLSASLMLTNRYLYYSSTDLSFFLGSSVFHELEFAYDTGHSGPTKTRRKPVRTLDQGRNEIAKGKTRWPLPSCCFTFCTAMAGISVSAQNAHIEKFNSRATGNE